MCPNDSLIKLQIHWNTAALVNTVWSIGELNFVVLKQGFDVYCGVTVYVVDSPITLRLINNSLVIGEKHFKEHVECQS